MMKETLRNFWPGNSGAEQWILGGVQSQALFPGLASNLLHFR